MCLSGFDRISDSHFFSQFPKKIGKLHVFQRENSGNSLILLFELGIRENFRAWVHSQGTLFLWDLIVVFFKVPDAPTSLS